jgi:hypothetical protein
VACAAGLAGFSPIYVFYNFTTSGLHDPEDWGCTFAPAADVFRVAVEQPGYPTYSADTTFATLAEIQKPWYQMFQPPGNQSVTSSSKISSGAGGGPESGQEQRVTLGPGDGPVEIIFRRSSPTK